MSRTASAIAVTALSLLLLFLSACGPSAPTRFYLLNSLAGPDLGKREAAVQPRVTIGIGPVKLPAYLDRQQIVTRINENELHLAEFDVWAEPLKDNLTRVLVENLNALLSEGAFDAIPFGAVTQIDYQVEVEVIRMDGSLGGTASLIARWTVFKRQGREMLLTRTSSLREPASGPDYEALIAAQSRTVEALSREVADAIQGPSIKKGNP
ncbi:MAG: uncharacterized protein QG552_34 [Thermodesulfobacteriota bacterium]|nr:uncharacterized protein [Thermodesulfobacteriota bacterium]